MIQGFQDHRPHSPTLIFSGLKSPTCVARGCTTTDGPYSLSLMISTGVFRNRICLLCLIRDRGGALSLSGWLLLQ